MCVFCTIFAPQAVLNLIVLGPWHVAGKRRLLQITACLHDT
jgi:hypothetical protein